MLRRPEQKEENERDSSCRLELFGCLLCPMPCTSEAKS